MAFWRDLTQRSSAAAGRAGTSGARRGTRGTGAAGGRTAGAALRARPGSGRPGGRPTTPGRPTPRAQPRPGQAGRAGRGGPGVPGGTGGPGARRQAGGAGPAGGKRARGLGGRSLGGDKPRSRPRGRLRGLHDGAGRGPGPRPATGGQEQGSEDGQSPGDPGGRHRLRRRRRWYAPKVLRRTRRKIRWTVYLALLLPVAIVLLSLGGGNLQDQAKLVAAEAAAASACPANPDQVAQQFDIPLVALAAYCGAAIHYQVDWTILAGIGQQECDHGRSTLTGCPPHTANQCGARGPMQFLGNVWRPGTDTVPTGQCPGPDRFTADPTGPPTEQGREADGYATDGNGDGVANPWDFPDAAAAAARYLVAHGVAENPAKAINAYNPNEAYVAAVLQYSAELKGRPAAPGSLDLHLADCPGPPLGSTRPPPFTKETPATQAMATSLLACFGTNGHDVGCYQPRLHTVNGRVQEGDFEHPRGRACDFMMTDGGVANDVERTRGQRFAEFAEAHADELHIIYVIWFEKIWYPHDGNVPWERWGVYHCNGQASDCHLNHVHVSVHYLPGDPPIARCVPGIACTM